MKKYLEWSKILTAWVLALNSYVVYHGIHLCYVMISNESAQYNFAWISTLISVVAGLGNLVVAAYMGKSGKENTEKIKVNSTNENYP